MGDEIIGMNTRDQITLKVFIEATKLRKAFRFSVDSTVHEVLVDIRNKTHGASAGDYKFGLFLPPNRESGQRGYWLQENRKIRFYGFSMETEVEYKTKERPLKVKLIDERILTVKIDDSLTAREICNIVAEKLNIKGSDEFSLSKPCPETMQKARPWLTDDMTLHEQDVGPDDILEFAKRYFFNDDFVDPEDPYTLHLLYVGANKAIIDGSYPVKVDECVELAGYAVQITYGDHNPKVHIPGFLDPLMIVPKIHRKDWKKIERLILKQHEKFFRMKETVAKFRYIQKVRALDTYGITFFECQECIEKGRKQKWKPVLIGITKDKIMKVDHETQELQGEWTWTQICRWSAKADTFLFDFGDYAKEYLTIRSTETEALNSLVTGYIELILKNLQDVAADGLEDSDDIAEIEEITGDFDFAQAGATATYNHPYYMGGLGQMLWDPSKYGNIDAGQSGPWAHTASPAMMTNANDMGSALKASKMLSDELGSQKGKWGNKGAVKEAEWNRHFEASNSALSNRMEDILNTVQLGAGGKLNRQQLDMKSQDLVVQMMNMTTAARALAAYNDDKSALLDGAKAVADCVADLMQLLNSSCDDPLGAEALKEALAACKQMFANSEMLLNDPSLIEYVDKGAELLMLKCVEDVDRSLQGLVNVVSRGIEDLPKQQQNVLMIDVNKVNAVRGIAVSSLAQLVPYSLNPTILDKIVVSSKTLQLLSTTTLNSAIAMVPSTYANSLEAGAKRVTDALNNLMMAASTAEAKSLADVDLTTPLKQVLLETVTMKNNIGDKDVTQNCLSEIKELDVPIHKSFVALQKISNKQAKNVLDNAYTDMVNAEKLLFESKAVTIPIIDNFTTSVNTLDKCSQSSTALNQLRHATKVLLASLMGLGTDIHLIAPTIDDKNQVDILVDYSTNVNSHIPIVISLLKNSSTDPQNIAKALELVSFVNEQLPTQSQLATEAKRAARDIADLNDRQKLDMSAGEVQKNIQELVAAARLVSDIAGLSEVEKVMGGFDLIKSQLEQVRSEIEAGQLKPMPRQSKENAAAMLKAGLQSIDLSLAEGLAVNKGAAGLVAPIRSSLTGLSQVVAAILPLIATTTDKNQHDLLDAAANSLYKATFEVASSAKFNQIEKENPARLKARDDAVVDCKKEIAKMLAEANNLDNKEFDSIINHLEKAKKALNKNDLLAQQANAPVQAFAALPIAAKPVRSGAMQLTTSLQTDPLSAPRISSVLADNTAHLLQLCSVAASSVQDLNTQNNILDAAREVADCTIAAVKAAKACQKEPSDKNMNDLAKAEAAVDASLQKLNFNSGGKPSDDSKKACDKIANLLANLNSIPVTACSPADVRQEYIASSKDAANLVGALVSTARSANSLDNGVAAKETANAVYNLLASALAAKKSNGSEAPLSLDAVRICKATNEILSDPDDAKSSLQAAKKATLNTANLVAQAKQLGKTEKNPEVRVKLMTAAQTLIDSTSDLGEAAKVAANKRTALSIQNLSKVANEVNANAKALDEIIRKIKGITPEATNSEASNQLVAVSRDIAQSISDVIARSAEVAANSTDQDASERLVKAQVKVNEEFDKAMQICSKVNPALVAVEATIENIKQLSNSLGGAQALSKAGKLPSSSSDIRATIQSCQDLIAANKVLQSAATGTSAQLEQAVGGVDNSIKALAKRVVGVAAGITDNYAQQQLLSTAKGLTDSQINLLEAIPATSSDNPKSLLLLAQAAQLTANELNLLISQLNVETGFDGMDSAKDIISASLAEFKKSLSAELGSLQDYDSSYMELLKASQNLAAALSGLVNSDKKNQAAVMGCVSQVSLSVPEFIQVVQELIANAPKEQRGLFINETQSIGDQAIALINSVNSICRGNDDAEKMNAQYAALQKSLANTLAQAKACAVGDQLISKAIRDLDDVGNDVYKGKLYADANILPVDKSTTVSELQKNAFKELKSIKDQVGEFTQIINNGNAETLGQNAVALAELEKNAIEPLFKAIAKVSDKQAQKAAVDALRKLVSESRELVEQSRDSLRGNFKAKERVPILVSQIQADTIKLIEDVKSSSSAVVKGEKELDMFKKAIRDMIQNNVGNDAVPSDVIEAAREVFQITSDLVFADNIDAAILSGKASVEAIRSLLSNCRGVAATCDETIGDGLIDSSQFVAKAMIKMLEVSKYDKLDPETKPKLEEAASTITTGIDEVVRILRMIPGASNLSLHGADLNFVALDSLAETLKIVKEQGLDLQSSKKLTRTKKGGEVDQTDINNALFDAGFAITAATSAVVGVGSQIQKTRTNALADLTKKSIKTDPTALSALIGSSKETAGAITNLAKATKASSYKLDEKQLVASANSVTQATSHMVGALKAGATDQEAETVEKLIQYNGAVVEAVNALMSAVHRASSFNEVVEDTSLPDTGKVKELEIQIKILKLDKAIKREQKKLEAMKSAQK